MRRQAGAVGRWGWGGTCEMHAGGWGGCEMEAGSKHPPTPPQQAGLCSTAEHGGTLECRTSSINGTDTKMCGCRRGHGTGAVRGKRRAAGGQAGRAQARRAGGPPRRHHSASNSPLATHLLLRQVTLQPHERAVKQLHAAAQQVVAAGQRFSLGWVGVGWFRLVDAAAQKGMRCHPQPRRWAASAAAGLPLPATRPLPASVFHALESAAVGVPGRKVGDRHISRLRCGWGRAGTGRGMETPVGHQSEQ